jgi:GMP synthase (glutamine-hydrolysing)
MKKVVILKTGVTLDSVRAAYGDFDVMFLRQLGEMGAEFEVIEVHQGAALPELDRFEAAIVTGSPHSVTERAAWAEHLAAWVNAAIDADKYVLGVCYGHQLLAHARGGRVEKNPNGYEVGVCEVALTKHGEKDPLLGAIARGRTTLEFNETHSDAVVELPQEARLLATSAMTPIQAFSIGARAWGVQFHPEFTTQVMRLYIEGRTPLIEKTAQARGESAEAAIARVKASVKETPLGREFLRRFVEHALHPSR